MLEKLAETTVGRDTITLYMTDTPPTLSGSPAAPHDGYRDRYVFDVTGPRISGMGAVGAQTAWVAEGQREIQEWQPGATPRLDVWVDARTLASDEADGDEPITLNGTPYRHGVTYHGDRLHHSSVSRAHDYGRLTDAASDRLMGIFHAVRDMFLTLPDVEKATACRTLGGERSRQNAIIEEAEKRVTALTDALYALILTGE